MVNLDVDRSLNCNMLGLQEPDPGAQIPSTRLKYQDVSGQESLCIISSNPETLHKQLNNSLKELNSNMSSEMLNAHLIATGRKQNGTH